MLTVLTVIALAPIITGALLGASFVVFNFVMWLICELNMR